MINSGISTLDASDLSYQFEVALKQGVSKKQGKIDDYVTNRLRVTIPSNLQYVDSFRDAKTGTSGVAFKDTNTGQVVVAYTGTNPNESADFWHDVDTDIRSIGLGLNYHYEGAYAFYEKMTQEYGAENIVLTGHSLGGNVAQRVALKYNALHTVVYNAAPVALLSTQNTWDLWTLLLEKKKFTGTVTRISTTKDPLTNAMKTMRSMYLGQAYTIKNSGGHGLKDIIKDFAQIRQVAAILAGSTVAALKKRKALLAADGLSSSEAIYLDSMQALAVAGGISVIVEGAVEMIDASATRANEAAQTLYNNLQGIGGLGYGVSMLSTAEVMGLYNAAGLSQATIIDAVEQLTSEKKTKAQAAATIFSEMEKGIKQGIESKIQTDTELAGLFQA